MGRLVCSRLVDGGFNIRAFDLASANFAGLPDDVEAVPGDLTDPADVAAAVAGVDAVFTSLPYCRRLPTSRSNSPGALMSMALASLLRRCANTLSRPGWCLARR